MTTDHTSATMNRVEHYVIALAVLSLAVLVANTFAIIDQPPAVNARQAIGAAAVFLFAYVLLERNAIMLAWREHRVSTSLVEIAVYLGFVTLSAPLIILLVPVSLTATQLVMRRPPIKGVFNIAHGAIAAGAGGSIYTLALMTGLPAWVAAIPATAAFSLTSDLQVAKLFGILERIPLPQVYAERFLMANTLAITTGIPAGIVALSLVTLHPAALLAAVPIAVLLHRNGQLQARADRELEVHRRLERDARHLIGAREAEAISQQVLRSCLDLLDAESARLRLADGRTWHTPSRPPMAPRAPLEATIEGRDGELLGTLTVWERPAKGPYGEDERTLLHLLAGQAAHGFESATALAEVASQRDVIIRQEKLSALGTMLASVAHEINNPLSYMRLRVETAKMATTNVLTSPTTSAETRAYAEKMTKSVETLERGLERLGAISHSLKVVARPGDGARAPTDLNDVTDQVLTVLKTGHKDIAFEVDLDPTLPPVMANASEMHQVVLNLLKNASDALEGRTDACIRITTHRHADDVTLSIADNGPGIPADAQARMFTPFFTTKAKGTGLGLSISHQIVAAHGGELTFDSTIGRGTTFRIRLPAPTPEPTRVAS